MFNYIIGNALDTSLDKPNHFIQEEQRIYLYRL